MRLDQAVQEFTRQYVELVLAETDHNVSRTARLLGCNRTHLYRVMERVGVSRVRVREIIDAR